MSLPVVDYALLKTDRREFLSQLRHALTEVGFLVLANAPGLDDSFQQRMFKEVRAMFDAPREVKASADIRLTPYFRGHSGPTKRADRNGQIIEAFQYGFECEPLAEYDDESVPVYKRLFRGPNTWPDEEALPGFRPAVNDLNAVYHSLTHELGHLICECLNEDPAQFDKYFDFDDPDLAASLNHNHSMSEIPEEMRGKVLAEYSKLKSPYTGAHIDGPPFVALLVNDRPGLQVVADSGGWIDAPVTCRTAPGDYGVPVIPGSVIVNSGGTLMHLSGGRIGATLHRVNTSLIPEGETRVSLPYFLLPKMDGPLVPFGDSDDTDVTTDTGYEAERDRGTNAAVNRMGTFPQVTRRWWKAEFARLGEKHRQEVQAETESAFELAKRRAKQDADAAARL